MSNFTHKTKNGEECFIASNISQTEVTYYIMQFADGRQHKMRRDNVKLIK